LTLEIMRAASRQLVLFAAAAPLAASLHYAPVLRRTSVRATSRHAATLRPAFAVMSEAASSAAAQPPPPSDAMENFRSFSASFCNLFPVWIVATAITGLVNPAAFACVSTKYFTGLIGMLMLCMGITLTPNDFKRVLTRPGAVLLAFVGCYGLMPFLSIVLSRALGLSPSLTAGMILLSGINGAQASNLCTYIAKGDVALSVLMTTMCTVGAIVMTPLVAKVLLGTVVPVNAQAVALSTMQVVLVPISLGMLINAKFPRFVQKVLPFSPIVGVVSTCALVGASVGGTAAPILAAGVKLQAACALLHLLGAACAYFGTKKFTNYPEKTCRTFGIQLAMKSSAFGYLLATLHFASDPLVRVPSAVSIVWMSLIGASLAVLSRFNPPAEDE
jgi:BASS family bile acid:Na+ symporter